MELKGTKVLALGIHKRSGKFHPPLSMTLFCRTLESVSSSLFFYPHPSPGCRYLFPERLKPCPPASFFPWAPHTGCSPPSSRSGPAELLLSVRLLLLLQVKESPLTRGQEKEDGDHLSFSFAESLQGGTSLVPL